jgi:hypothetical protein
MTDTFRCGDNAALVGYLYDDCEPGEREQIAAHLARCAVCLAEVESLRTTREQLAAWNPPEMSLGFQITRSQIAGPRLLKGESPETADPASPATKAAWWNRPLPAWAQAAAAAVIFASGLAIGATRGGSEADAARSATTPQAAPQVAAAPVASVTPGDLAALEQRVLGALGEQVSQLRAASAPAPLSAKEEQALLRKVNTLIEESEARQRADMTLRTASVARQMDAQRRLDLAQVQGSMGQIQQSVGQIQRITGAEVRDQRQAVDYLLRVNQRR